MAKTVAPETGIDDNGLRWKDFKYGTQTYRIREITVDESDAAFDASKLPGESFNPRFNQRLQLCSSIVSPATSVDEISKWSVGKLLFLLNAYDSINTLAPADEAGNA